MKHRKNQNNHRHGFSLVEVLIAVSITAVLMTATLAALDASFRAYQSTTEEVSTHSIGRMVMHRLLTMIRTGTEFGPYPEDPRIRTVESDFLEFRTQTGEIVILSWNRIDETLTYQVEGQPTVEILDGVVGTTTEDGTIVKPFTLEYANGRKLYRASIDLTVEPDEVISLDIEGDQNNNELRFIGSAMPRLEAF